MCDGLASHECQAVDVESVVPLALPNTPKLKRGGQEGKRIAAGQSATPAAQICGRGMPGPLSLAAHG